MLVDDMGVDNLLLYVRSITKKSHLCELKGKKVAIDGLIWLYRGGYGCAENLATGTMLPEVFLKYFMKNLDLLNKNGSKFMVWYLLSLISNYLPHPFPSCVSYLSVQDEDITVVLDGDSLPGKGLTQTKRREVRAANLEKARELVKNGDHEAAIKKYKQCVSVSSEMIEQVNYFLADVGFLSAMFHSYANEPFSYLIQTILALRERGIKLIIAAYESDPVLALLSMEGMVDVVITEDSDLLVYGKFM